MFRTFERVKELGHELRKELEKIEESVEAEVQASVEFADNSPFPNPDEIYKFNFLLSSIRHFSAG